MDDALRAEIAATRWYHTIALGGGIVTPGEFDLRRTVARVPLPAATDGMRCLDVGTRDGFWAFELERRGAAEVLGIDVDDTAQHDWPTPRPVLSAEQESGLEASRHAFDVARRALGSLAQRRNLSVYDLQPTTAGRFDLAFVGTLLVHLRDPVAALMAIRRVLLPDGLLVVNEPISVGLSVLRPRSPSASLMTLDAPFWWLPNREALRRYVVAAGFAPVRVGRPYLVAPGPSFDRPPLARRNALGSLARQLVLRAGLPHVAVAARVVADR